LRTTGGAQIEIGLIAGGLGTRPSVHLLAGGEIVLVGYDIYVAGVEISAAKVRFEIELAGVFYEFLEGPSDDTAIVVHELGAAMIDRKGVERWSVITDIIREWNVDKTGGLWLTTLHRHERARVDIVTGEIPGEEGG